MRLRRVLSLAVFLLGVGIADATGQLPQPLPPGGASDPARSTLLSPSALSPSTRERPPGLSLPPGSAPVAGVDPATATPIPDRIAEFSGATAETPEQRRFDLMASWTDGLRF